MHLQRGKAAPAAADANDRYGYANGKADGHGGGYGDRDRGAAFDGGTDGELMHGRVCMGAYGRGRGAASRASADADDDMRENGGDDGELLDRGWGRNGHGKVARAAAAADADDAYMNTSDATDDGELMSRSITPIVRRGRGSKSCGSAADIDDELRLSNHDETSADEIALEVHGMQT